MINFASNLNKMIDAGLGGPLDPPRTEVAVGHHVVYTEVSGDVVNFETNVIAPVKNLRVIMEPIQDLNGQDSPYPAGGGKNLLDPSLLVTQASWKVLEVPLTPGTYTMSTNVTAEESSELAMYFRKNASDTQSSTTLVTSTHPVTRVIEEGDTPVLSFRRVSGTKVFADYEWQIEEGSTATPYTPYENICPITGRDAVTVTRSGKNLLNYNNLLPAAVSIGFTVDSDGNVKKEPPTGDARNWSFAQSNWQVTLPAGTYILSWTISTATTNTAARLRIYTSDGTVKASVSGANAFTIGTHSRTFELTEKTSIGIIVKQYESVYKIQLENGSTASAWSPYDGQTATIQLGTTVYGGTVDVTGGSALKTMDIRDLSALTWRYYAADNYFYASMGNRFPNGTNGKGFCSSYKFYGTAISATLASMPDMNFGFTSNSGSKYIYIKDSRYTDAASFQTAVAGVQLVYDLQPSSYEEITTDPVEMSTLKGQNNVWSDAGNISLEYPYYEETEGY